MIWVLIFTHRKLCRNIDFLGGHYRIPYESILYVSGGACEESIHLSQCNSIDFSKVQLIAPTEDRFFSKCLYEEDIDTSQSVVSREKSIIVSLHLNILAKVSISRKI